MLALGISACFPVSSTTQGATSTPQPTSTETYYPLSTQTGIQEIDNILEAVAGDDIQMLRSLIKFTPAKCTHLDGLGGPPKCRAAEAEGTPLDVLPFLGSEGSFLRKDEIDDWPGIEVSGLYAVYDVSPDAFSEENYPAGESAILLVGEKDRPAVSLHLSEGGIVRIDTIFDPSPQSLDDVLQREASSFILAPLSR
jgi:hypothetical protein